MDALTDQLLSASFLDWLAILTSLLYVWLAAKDNNWCWLFAAISTAVWAWQSFFEYQLVSDGFLQVFYFIMAGVGIWQWRNRKTSSKEQSYKADPSLLDDSALPIRPKHTFSRMTAKEHAYVIGGGLVAGQCLYLFVSGVFVSAATLPDAMTTAFSVITTFLLIGRRLENWLYWIAIDAVYVWIYGSTGAILFSLMMLINIGMAIYGYLNWRKELSTPKATISLER